MLFVVGSAAGQYFRKEAIRRQDDPEPGIFFLKLKLEDARRTFVFDTTKSQPEHTVPPYDSILIQHGRHFYFFILAKFVKVPQLIVTTGRMGRAVSSAGAKNRLILLESSPYSLPD
jgi:hypothetical protein